MTCTYLAQQILRTSTEANSQNFDCGNIGITISSQRTNQDRMQKACSSSSYLVHKHLSDNHVIVSNMSLKEAEFNPTWENSRAFLFQNLEGLKILFLDLVYEELDGYLIHSCQMFDLEICPESGEIQTLHFFQSCGQADQNFLCQDLGAHL